MKIVIIKQHKQGPVMLWPPGPIPDDAGGGWAPDFVEVDDALATELINEVGCARPVLAGQAEEPTQEQADTAFAGTRLEGVPVEELTEPQQEIAADVEPSTEHNTREQKRRERN